MTMKICLLPLGGTIAAEPYPTAFGEYPRRATLTDAGLERLVEGMERILIARGIEDFEIDTHEICNKDSNHINRKDRARLLRTVQKTDGMDYDAHVITMGTDTMCRTMRLLAERKKKFEHDWRCTGAIWPLSNVKTDLGKIPDAQHNMAMTLLHPARGPDLYISLGTVFARALDVYKDYGHREFKARRSTQNLIAPGWRADATNDSPILQAA